MERAGELLRCAERSARRQGIRVELRGLQPHAEGISPITCPTMTSSPCAPRASDAAALVIVPTASSDRHGRPAASIAERRGQRLAERCAPRHRRAPQARWSARRGHPAGPALAITALVPAALAIAGIFWYFVLRPLRAIDRAISDLGRGAFSHAIAISGPADLVGPRPPAGMAAHAARRHRARAEPLPAPHVARTQDPAREYPRGDRPAAGRRRGTDRRQPARSRLDPARERAAAPAAHREPAVLQRLEVTRERRRVDVVPPELRSSAR